MCLCVFLCPRKRDDLVCNRWVRGGVFFPLLSLFPVCLLGVEDFIKGIGEMGWGVGGGGLCRR